MPPSPSSSPALLAAVIRVVDLIAGVRYLVCGAVAAAVTWAGLALNPMTVTDLGLFDRFSTPLLHGHLGAVYADPGNQGGPLELGWVGILSWLARVADAPARPFAGSLTSVAVVVAVLMSMRHLAGGAPDDQRRRVELACGLVVALSAAGWAGGWGHPADVAIPLLWLGAAALATRGRTLAPALMVAASAGWETWGILGIVVLVAAGWKRGVAASAIATAGGLAWYAPFRIAGAFSMGRVRWPVTSGTFLHLLGYTEMSWSLRVVQAIVVMLAGVGGVVATRGRPGQRWLPVFVLLALRVATDPIPFPYYWTLPLIPLLMGFAIDVAVGARIRCAVAAGIGLVVSALPHPDPPFGYPQLILAAALAAFAGLSPAAPSVEPARCL